MEHQLSEDGTMATRKLWCALTASTAALDFCGEMKVGSLGGLVPSGSGWHAQDFEDADETIVLMKCAGPAPTLPPATD